MELFQEMCAAPAQQNLAPNQFTYNALISVLTASGRMDLAGTCTNQACVTKQLRRYRDM